MASSCTCWMGHASQYIFFTCGLQLNAICMLTGVSRMARPCTCWMGNASDRNLNISTCRLQLKTARHAHRSEPDGKFLYVLDGAVTTFSQEDKEAAVPVPPCIRCVCRLTAFSEDCQTRKYKHSNKTSVLNNSVLSESPALPFKQAQGRLCASTYPLSTCTAQHACPFPTRYQHAWHDGCPHGEGDACSLAAGLSHTEALSLARSWLSKNHSAL